MPVLITLLLDEFNPVVGHVHGHAVVEAVAAVLQRRGQAGHARHLFGDGDGLGIDLVDQVVGQREIAEGFVVLMAVEIVIVAGKSLTQPVAVVYHRGDTVESEAVEAIFLQPILAVGEQEVDDLVLTVVEAETVPLVVEAARPGEEVLRRVAGQIAQPLVLVFDSVAVDQVHDDGKAHAVGVVDEMLQLVGGAETAGRGEEVGHVVAETAIVGMLLDGHDLDGIVSGPHHTRQHSGAEFFVRAHALCVLGHANVAFVDEQRVTLGAECAGGESVRLVGLPHLGGKDGRLLILHGTLAPRRHTLAAAAVPIDFHLVQVAVLHARKGQLQLPHAVFQTLQAVYGEFLPTVEVADKIYLRGIGSPLAEYPSRRRAVQTKVEVTVGKLRQRAACRRRKRRTPAGIMGMTPDDGSFVRF